MVPASEVAWSTQAADGSWVFPADVGPSSTAHAIITLAKCEQLDPAVGLALARGLAVQQLPDGSFQRFALAPIGDVPTSALVAAALEIAGGDAEKAAAARAWAFVERHGGLDAVAAELAKGDFAIVFLVAAKRAPAELIRKPGVELFAVPGLARALARRMHSGVLTLIGQMAFVASEGEELSAARRWTFRRAFDYGAQYQNDDGSFNSFTMTTAIAACAYRASGDAEGRRRADRAAGWIASRVLRTAAGGAWVPEFSLPTWSTVYHLRAVLHAGAAADDPRVLRGAQWLLDTQQRRPQARPNQPVRGAPLVGGWAYDPENHTLPDCDDTGVVLSVLAMIRDGLPASHPMRTAIDGAVGRAFAWLAAMQNDDGGWAAYNRGLPSKKPGSLRVDPIRLSNDPRSLLRLVRNPPPFLGDPSTEDVTARVLHGLGGFGATRDRADVKRAIGFLRRQQCDDGSFWGRWLMNHLAGSAYALQAARAVGEPLDAVWVNRTAGFVLGCQNADGSWGELPASYLDASKAGRGPGMAPLTGLVITGLCDAGLRNHPATLRGIAYLLDRQRPEGDWSDDGWIVPLLPPDTFYAHPEAGLYYALEALGRWARG
jgi:squalene cyclase